MFKSLQWEDWSGAVLGAWLLASPWAVGYSDVTAAVMNALIVGTILVVGEFMKVGVHEAIHEWLDLVPGAWLVVSPIVLGFQSSVPASANAIAVGVLIIVLAIVAITDFDKMVAHWWRDRATHA